MEEPGLVGQVGEERQQGICWCDHDGGSQGQALEFGLDAGGHRGTLVGLGTREQGFQEEEAGGVCVLAGVTSGEAELLCQWKSSL